jgi:putative Mg2+ transporter-C (MgtC) family protein
MTDGLSELDVLVRVIVAAALGGLIGVERERHTVAAGIRTHMLVAVGACLLTGAVLLFAQQLGASARADVLRIASGIATGVGFIGAGTIIVTRGRVKGLTTAATIWVTAAVGVTAGLGFLLLALLVAGPLTISILMLGFVEKRLQQGGLLRPDGSGPDELEGDGEARGPAGLGPDDEGDESGSSPGLRPWRRRDD